MMIWRTDRRGFLKTAGAGFAAAMASPNFAWAADGDTLRLRVDSDLQVLDPFGLIGGVEEVINRCTLVSLIKLGDIREGNQWQPWGAEKLEWLDDTRLAFTLRDGLVWSGDFGPVTTADVKFSFERFIGSESAWGYQFEKLKEVEVIDDRSGVIHLTDPFEPFVIVALQGYGGQVVCKAAMEAVGGSYTTDIPASCGPYLLDGWEQQQKITLVANPAWTGAPMAFARIEIYIVTDDQAALLAYEADAFDYTWVAVASVDQLKSAMPPASVLIEAESTRYAWLSINKNAETLKDIKVRQAIQYAYDGDAVLQGAFNGLVGRSAGVIQPSTPFARKTNLIATRDVDKAKALLAEAGINVEIQPTEDAAYWAAGDKSTGDQYLSLELVLQSFAGGVDPTENLVWFRADQIGIYNWSFFDDPEFETLYQASLSERDQAKRTAIFNQMEDLMEASGCFIFICFEPLIAIHRDTIKPVIIADGHPDPALFGRV
jgi:peptide/nickel transport system substrate-binding protein